MSLRALPPSRSATRPAVIGAVLGLAFAAALAVLRQSNADPGLGFETAGTVALVSAFAGPPLLALLALALPPQTRQAVWWGTGIFTLLTAVVSVVTIVVTLFGVLLILAASRLRGDGFLMATRERILAGSIVVLGIASIAAFLGFQQGRCYSETRYTDGRVVIREVPYTGSSGFFSGSGSGSGAAAPPEADVVSTGTTCSSGETTPVGAAAAAGCWVVAGGAAAALGRWRRTRVPPRPDAVTGGPA